MGVMKDLYTEIVELLETTNMTFKEIALTLDIPIEMVYDVAQDVGEFDE